MGKLDCAYSRKWVLEMIPDSNQFLWYPGSVGKILKEFSIYFCHSLVTLVRRFHLKDPFWTCKPFTRGFFAGDPDFIGVLCWKGVFRLLLIWTQTMVYGSLPFCFRLTARAGSCRRNCCCSFQNCWYKSSVIYYYNCSRYSCYCGRRHDNRASKRHKSHMDGCLMVRFGLPE